MAQIFTELIPAIRHSMNIDMPEDVSFEMLKEKLADYINHLIQADFEKLVSLLYRIDVSEAKLKYILKENPGEDAGDIIAELIIERQLQKIKSRQEHRRDSAISDEDAW
jgi:hypothetical protein